VPKNPSYEQFVLDVRGMGVDIFDPTPPKLGANEGVRFLEQDTHWTPEWMEKAAGQLAGFVRDVVTLPPPAVAPAWKRVAMPVTRVGDIVDMLKLTDGQTVFAPRTVTIHQVQDASGAEWEPDPTGDVLLLGDSFTNVFSLEPMGWGSAAGLAPQLAYALGRGVDVIAQNDSGAFATRQALARELGGPDDRLAGKRVVIWEFASRELAVGDWKPVDWDAAMAQGGK
jgi:alginate O-acetyltransferase complex protein AlgJ